MLNDTSYDINYRIKDHLAKVDEFLIDRLVTSNQEGGSRVMRFKT